jgi:hypothetical protein
VVFGNAVGLEMPWYAALSKLWEGPGEGGGAGGHTRHAEVKVGVLASSVSPWGEGGETTTTGRHARQREGKRKEKGLWCRDNDKDDGDSYESLVAQSHPTSLSCVAPLGQEPWPPNPLRRPSPPFLLAPELDHRPRERPGYTVAVIFS